MKAKRKKTAGSKPKQPTAHDGSLLTDDNLLLFRTMNDETASINDRMAAAMILAPIMHKPLPVHYVSAEEAHRLLEKALRK